MGKEQRKISPAVLEAYEEMERFFSEKGEKDLLQMMMYRYLSMVPPLCFRCGEKRR